MKPKLFYPVLGLLLVFFFCFFTQLPQSIKLFGGLAKASNPPDGESPLAGKEYVENQLIIKFAPGIGESQKKAVRTELNSVTLRELSLIGAELVELSGITVEQALLLLEDDSRVQYAEPNYIWHIDIIPNDPYFDLLWGMHNTGQTGGIPDADIDAPEAWNTSTGDSVIIGVIDTGVDTAHVDLLGNIWTNPGEIPNNGLDDDGNGYVDDIHGWDFVNWDNGPVDDHSHGTHVSGTIAAVGNNALGVVGVCWSAKIMALKFLDAWGYGTTSDAILAVEYATMMGANLTSNSWGGGPYSQALKDAIDSSGAHGMLFVAAAGNSWNNNDLYPHYPSSYDLDNIIAVAATDHKDQLADEPTWGSNYGLVSVDLGAPGVDIYSTTPGNNYGYMGGTSMATPHVSGTAALIWSEYPNLTHLQVKERIMSMAETKPTLLGMCVTGARLNAFLSIAEPDSIPPSPILDLAVAEAGGSWIKLYWTATGDDSSTGTASYYDLRYSLSPIDSSNFNSATQVPGEPFPQLAGFAESLTVTGLDFNTTYYFAIKALDEWGNPSGVSNSPSGTTLGPPDISVSPDSLSADLFTGETDIETLTIYNTGVSELSFDISITGTAGAYASLDFFSDKSIRSAKIIATGRLVSLEQLEIMRSNFQKVLSITPENLRDKGKPYTETTSETLLPQRVPGVEIFGSMENVFFAGPRTRGNLFTCTNSTTLIEHRFYLNPSTPTQLWFLVYEGNSQVGLYYLISASNVSPAGPGEGWYSSGDINVPLVAGRYYLIVASFEQMCYYYNQQDISPYPIPASFGQLTAGAGWDWAPTSNFPPDSIQDVPSYAFGDPVAYYQAIVTGVGTSWLSVNPDTGTVPTAGSTEIGVSFNASGLNGGDYDANIVISSNDPDEPAVTVPAHLHVTGAPDIATSDDTLDFGIVYIGYPESLSLLVSNEGTDILTVTGIASNVTEFSVDLTNFALAPDEDTVVNVTFAPMSVGVLWGNLTISSDDPDQPNLVVTLRGEGLICPDLWTNPSSVSESLYTDETSVETLTVGNSGGSPLYLQVELDNFAGPSFMKGVGSARANSSYRGSSSIKELLGPLSERKVNFDPNAKTTEGLYDSDQDGFSKISADPGDILTSWPAPSPIQLAWGLGFDGSEVWVSDPYGITDNEVSTTGVLLSWFSCTSWVGVWPGDMAWDGNYIWQVNVGGDNGIYQLEPATGAVLNSIHDPSHTWDATSQRGLAYDKKTDVFYIGGWNQGRVYKIKGLSWGNPGEIISYFDFPNVSGLAWHPRGTLWIAVNASTDYIFQVDPETGSIISQFLAPGTGGGYEGAGLAMDKSGNLWCVSQATNMVYLVESGVPAYNWLAINPEACTLGAGETRNLEVNFDATGLFGGDYTADILLQSNDCDQPSLTVPALLHVTGIPDIAVDLDTLNFGIVYIGYPESLSLLVSNKGTDILSVTGIASNVAEFSVDLTNFALAPDGDTVVNVTFAPTVVGEVWGVLTISSDDPDEPTYEVVLTASGHECPDLSIHPDTLRDSLLTGQTRVHTLFLKNAGPDTLIFSFPSFAEAILLNDTSTEKNNTGHLFSFVELGKDEIDTRIGGPVVLGAGGPDSSGYSWIDSDEPGGPVFDFIDISTTGTLVTGLADDNYVGPFPIGFSFPFYDSSYTEFYIQSNGVINFDNEYIPFTNQPIPQADGYDNLLAWCWDDLYGYTGKVYYQQMGNKLVVQYDGYGEYGAPGTVDAEVIIYSDGKILFQYDNFNNGFDVLGSTVGIENADGTDGLQVAFNTPYLHNDLAILFFRGARWITGVSPTSGSIPSGDSLAIEVTLSAADMYGGDYTDSLEISSNDCDNPDIFVPVLLHVTGAPDIAVSDDSLAYGSVFIGASVTETLTVTNEGTDLLTVSNISTDNYNYSVDIISFTLNPGENQKVVVTFTPSLEGIIWGNLTITSDDPDEPSLTVFLQGQGLVPPDISAFPDSLYEYLVTDEIKAETLTINNTGGSDLYFEILIEEAGSTSMVVDFFANESVRTQKVVAVGKPVSLDELEAQEFPFMRKTTVHSTDLIDEGMPFEKNQSEIEPLKKILGEEVFGNRDNAYFAGPRTRGNLFTCITPTTLAEHRLYINPSTSTQLWFLVYEGSAQVGTYNLISASNVSPAGPGEGWYSSGEVNVSLVAGKYYLIVASFEQQSYYYNQQDISPYPIPASFGELTAGAGWNWAPTAVFPPDPIQSVPASAFGAPVAYYQTLVTRAGVVWLEADPLSGTVPKDTSFEVVLIFDATDVSVGDYDANLIISSNDPDEHELSLPAHLRVILRGDANADFKIDISDVIYLINYVLDNGPEPKSLSAGDVNCDGNVVIDDIMYLINYLYRGGPPIGDPNNDGIPDC